MAQVILGLGSNLGYKLKYLRDAVGLIGKEIGGILMISSVYQTKALLPDQAPEEWDLDYYNIALKLSCDDSPEQLLVKLKSIEKKLGRDPNHSFWSPREIDIDILSFDHILVNSDELMIPHKELLNRRFALEPLLEIEPLWQHPSSMYKALDLHQHLKSMPEIKQAPFTICGSKLMAIINLSDDSFSNEGLLVPLSINDFLQQVDEVVCSGADVIDIGAESTKPGVKQKEAAEVNQVLIPYLSALDVYMRQQKWPIIPKISIDTYHAEVVEQVLQFPWVSIINDVYGLQEAVIAKRLSNSDVKYVFTHQEGKAGEAYLSANGQFESVLVAYAQKKIQFLQTQGLTKQQLIFDLGIGFGKHAYQSKHILRHLDYIKTVLGIPVMVGHSRKKTMTGKLAGEDNQLKDVATAVLTQELCQAGVDYIRVHNVAYAAIAKSIGLIFRNLKV